MYYILNRDSIGGLLKEIHSESVTTLSFSIANAISFQRRSDARKYLHNNNLQNQFKAIKIQHS
jgi:hypothetical protein